MKIAIDLMGGEGCGEQNLEGCLAYPYAEELIVIGDIVRLDQQKINVLVERGAQLRSCAAALTGNETPRALLKRSHDTSLAIGMQMLADKKADALVSSADTKARWLDCIGQRLLKLFKVHADNSICWIWAPTCIAHRTCCDNLADLAAPCSRRISYLRHL